jgi:ABC-2 type transport system permease protein
VIRAFVSGVWINVLQFTRSPFDLASVIVWPIVYATIAYYLVGAHHEERALIGASFGAALMLMWTMVVIGSAGVLELQRWLGTLELIVAAPVPLVAVIGSITVASATFGAYAIVATLAWGRFAFHIPLTIAHPLAFALAVPSTVLSIGLLGLIVASTFVLYRAAFSLGVALQYPVWIVCGLLAPLSLLPHFVNVIAWFLAPYWGLRALKTATLGGDAWTPILMCFAVAAAYVVAGSAGLTAFVRVARSRGSLKLT